MTASGYLLAAARGGNWGAFDELVRSTYADAYTLAFWMTGNPEDAYDVVEEACLRAFDAIRWVTGDWPFSTWMYRITANCASRLLSHQGEGRSEALDDGEAPPHGRPRLQREAVVEVGCMVEELRAALVELPFPLRAVVVLHDIYGVDHEAIATELDIAEEEVKMRLSQARRTLRRRLFPLLAERGHVVSEDAAVLTSETEVDALALDRSTISTPAGGVGGPSEPRLIQEGDGPGGCGPGRGPAPRRYGRHKPMQRTTAGAEGLRRCPLRAGARRSARRVPAGGPPLRRRPAAMTQPVGTRALGRPAWGLGVVASRTWPSSLPAMRPAPGARVARGEAVHDGRADGHRLAKRGRGRGSRLWIWRVSLPSGAGFPQTGWIGFAASTRHLRRDNHGSRDRP